MSLRRGQGWGAPGPLAAGGAVASNDAQVRSIVEGARRAGVAPPAVGLLGGDLCRTLGGTGDRNRLFSGDAMSFAVDVGTAVVDGERHWFVAHLVGRRAGLAGLRGLRGRVLAVMNAEWLGSWDVATRSHPGDGRLDVIDADLSFSQRLAARRRLPTGTHVPHPSIHERRVASWEAELDRPMEIWLDGVRVGRGRHLAVAVEHEALTVVV